MSLELRSESFRTRGEQLLSNPGLGTNDVVQSLPLAEEQLGPKRDYRAVGLRGPVTWQLRLVFYHHLEFCRVVTRGIIAHGSDAAEVDLRRLGRSCLQRGLPNIHACARQGHRAEPAYRRRLRW